MHDFQDTHVFVLRFGEIIVTTSCIIFAVDTSSVPSFVFIKLLQVLSGLWVTLEGCCGVWGLSSGISTGLVLMCRHACSYANRNM